MNAREKLLAGMVGSLFLLLAIAYFGDMYLDERTKLQGDIEAAREKIREQEFDFEVGTRSTEDLRMMEERALPWDADLAQRLYQSWLLDLCDEKVGFSSPVISFGGTKYVEDRFAAHQVTVACKGDIEQLTRFLHEFYETDMLHYFESLSVRPTAGSREMTLTFVIGALSMPDAPAPSELKPLRWKRLQLESVDQYVRAIAYRNPFGFKNKRPDISMDRSLTVTLGDRLEVTPEVTDGDKGDGFSFSADLEEFPEARFDDRTGRFSWRPRELGEHRLKIYVTDNGFPPETSYVEASVRVVEPEAPVEAPAPDVFDNAKLAVITAILKSQGRMQVWVSTRFDGNVVKLREGDRLEIGKTNGVIKAIGARDIQFETSDGELKTVGLGQALSDAQVVSSGE